MLWTVLARQRQWTWRQRLGSSALLAVDIQRHRAALRDAATIAIELYARVTPIRLMHFTGGIRKYSRSLLMTSPLDRILVNSQQGPAARNGLPVLKVFTAGTWRRRWLSRAQRGDQRSRHPLRWQAERL